MQVGEVGGAETRQLERSALESGVFRAPALAKKRARLSASSLALRRGADHLQTQQKTYRLFFCIPTIPRASRADDAA
jgi:hypothetical protein